MITKAALLIFRLHGTSRELMFVRAKGKDFYVFPGGKKEHGESIEAALSRELEEELRVGITDVRCIGIVHGATPDGREMEMHLFTGDISGVPSPHAEIVEILWCGPDEVDGFGERMTPMTKEKVLPHLRAKGLF